jgi:hypothetical protein
VAQSVVGGRVVPALIVLGILFLTAHNSVSIKKDYSGSSTVQASDGDVRSVVVRLIGRQTYAFRTYIVGRSVGGIRVRLTDIRAS